MVLMIIMNDWKIIIINFFYLDLWICAFWVIENNRRNVASCYRKLINTFWLIRKKLPQCCGILISKVKFTCYSNRLLYVWCNYACVCLFLDKAGSQLHISAQWRTHLGCLTTSEPISHLQTTQTLSFFFVPDFWLLFQHWLT